MTIYSITNKAPSPRIIYDVKRREINIPPGGIKLVEISDGLYGQLALRGDLLIQPAAFAHRQQMANNPIVRPASVPVSKSSLPPIQVTGHIGIGDNIHQRAVMRELMKRNDVWLHTCHFNLYHDLIDQGLKLVMRPTGLHAQAKTIQREHQLFTHAKFPKPPHNAKPHRIGYPKVLIDKHGSILESMFGCLGLYTPEKPDFSMPIKPAWRALVREKYLSQWNTGGKPLMVHRPVVVRREWDGRSRNPDPKAYDELYRSIRDQFFVVSIADLAEGREWIDGPRQDVDVTLHKGELWFEEMATVFAEADMVFCNAGFAPVLAQAVGTPNIVVYGGRESFRTTQRMGAHLAPTLPIDVINPCDCHSASHQCDKRIDMPVALARLQPFIDSQRDTLIFGTFYVDSPDRDGLTDLWKKLHIGLNPDCDFLAVDSQSPNTQHFADWTPYDGKRHRRMYFNFPDNIGHLSRPRVTLGKDGWGRAFCKGLEIACDLGYKYVAHVEGDSLFRLRVGDVVRQMREEGIDCASTTVEGMRIPGSNNGWVETGLMFFSTDYLKRSNFIQCYDWPNRKVAPTPERYIRQFIFEKDPSINFKMMPWKALRADRNQITNDNILGLDLDWVTHQHNSTQQDVYRKFTEAALDNPPTPAKLAVAALPSTAKEVPPCEPSRAAADWPQPGLLKLNLGCGTNKLQGWRNHDADMDITKRLPFDDGAASHINIEHCVEHIPYKQAIDFFKEAYRVLCPGGVLRVTVPSLEQIAKCDDKNYHQFSTKWQKMGPTTRGAMSAIIYAHGHEMVWNARLMLDTLYFCGFDDLRQCLPGQSDDPALRGVEGHGHVIGDKFNAIESCIHEARKGGMPPTVNAVNADVAIIIGGAVNWRDDLDEALKYVNGSRVQYFFINDQIKSFKEPGIACTLHPDKLNGHVGWLRHRKNAGLDAPIEIWSNRKHGAVTNDTASIDWSGSSGLFAVQVARRKGFSKIIACGVPMTVDGAHFERQAKWSSAMAFRPGWIQRKNEIAPYFRSMSGWTKEQFGGPTEEWISATVS